MILPPQSRCPASGQDRSDGTPPYGSESAILRGKWARGRGSISHVWTFLTSVQHKADSYRQQRCDVMPLTVICCSKTIAEEAVSADGERCRRLTLSLPRVTSRRVSRSCIARAEFNFGNPKPRDSAVCPEYWTIITAPFFGCISSVSRAPPTPCDVARQVIVKKCS